MSTAAYRIALVEDDAAFLKRLASRLEAQPGRTVVARCRRAEEALTRVSVSEPDLVLFDLSLHGVLRLDVLLELKQRLPGVPLVALTVEDRPAVMAQVIQAGATGYLLKGDDAELFAGIEDIRAGGAPAPSPAVARRLWEALRATPPPAVNPGVLTEREWEVLQLFGRGRQQKEISARLGIATNTVKNHCRHIYEKLGVNGSTGAMVRLRGGRGLLDD